MILNKPKRLIAIINGFEIGVESPSVEQDAEKFELFCEQFRVEVNKMLKKPETEPVPVVAAEGVS